MDVFSAFSLKILELFLAQDVQEAELAKCITTALHHIHHSSQVLCLDVILAGVREGWGCLHARLFRVALYSSWEMKEGPKAVSVGSRLTWDRVWLWERVSV